MWKESPDSCRKPVRMTHAKGVSARAAFKGLSGDWLADIRGAIPTRVYASASGDQLPRQVRSWGTQMQVPSLRVTRRQISGNLEFTRHGTQPAGRLVTVDPASARPCSSRDDVRLQALRRLGAPLARAPSRARSQASVVRAASRSDRPRMTAAPTAA